MQQMKMVQYTTHLVDILVFKFGTEQDDMSVFSEMEKKTLE